MSNQCLTSRKPIATTTTAVVLHCHHIFTGQVTPSGERKEKKRDRTNEEGREKQSEMRDVAINRS